MVSEGQGGLIFYLCDWVTEWLSDSVTQWLSDSVTDTGNSRDAYASKILGNKKSKLGTNLGTSINKI